MTDPHHGPRPGTSQGARQRRAAVRTLHRCAALLALWFVTVIALLPALSHNTNCGRWYSFDVARTSSGFAARCVDDGIETRGDINVFVVHRPVRIGSPFEYMTGIEWFSRIESKQSMTAAEERMVERSVAELLATLPDSDFGPDDARRGQPLNWSTKQFHALPSLANTLFWFTLAAWPLLAAAFGAAALISVRRSARRYIHLRQTRVSQVCIHCMYDLRPDFPRACPECGKHPRRSHSRTTAT